MFNPLTPYNDLPLLPPSTILDDIQLLKKVNSSNKALAELNGLLRTLENPEIILEPLRVKEAVESSGIENINTTISEALKAEIFPTNTLSPEQKETKNYKKALLLGFEMIQVRNILTTNDYCEIQKMLGIKHAGVRNLPGTMIANQNTGEIYYTPPSGEKLIRDLLNNFESYYNDSIDDPDYLIKLAILHYQFEAIHPFFDGNGRTGRILMVLYMVLHINLHSPALFISQYINQHRKEYYRLLRGVTERTAWIEWITFILDAVQTQANATKNVVLKILDLKSHFQKKVLPDFKFTYAHELLTYLFSNAFYTQAQLMKSTPIKSNKTALEYLNNLVKTGVLGVADSKTKAKIYFMPDFLKILE